MNPLTAFIADFTLCALFFAFHTDRDAVAEPMVDLNPVLVAAYKIGYEDAVVYGSDDVGLVRFTVKQIEEMVQ